MYECYNSRIFYILYLYVYVISNRNINISARRLLLLSVIRPSIEYGSEVWEGNKSQAGSLESIILDGAKRILGCSSKNATRQLEETWA